MKLLCRLWWIVVAIVLCYSLLNCAPVYSEEALSHIEVTVPDYIVEKIGDEDHVEIPGGDFLLVDGKPEIPRYSVSVEYPKGYRVTDVVLRERTGMTSAKGLKLLTVVMQPASALTDNQSSPIAGEGWYPEKDYNWRVWEDVDGKTTLVIVMYPFYYNTDTTEVKFYKNYRFDIEYIVSSVAITDLTTAKDFYQPGDKVSIDISLNNSGEAQDVVVNTVITRYGSSEILSGLPLRSLGNLIGDASLTVDWETNGVEAGYYCAEVTLTDTTGNVLDHKKMGFPLEESTEPPKIPILYIIIGAVVIAGAVASIFIIRSRKKASKPKNKV